MNTLRLEIKAFGVDVLTVYPGITRTPFPANCKEQMLKAWRSATNEVQKEYGEEFAQWLANTVQFGINWLAHDPKDSVDCLLDAVTASWPKTRYFSGLDARLIARPLVHIPDFL